MMKAGSRGAASHMAERDLELIEKDGKAEYIE
jgi:hypothetical protein